MTENVNFNFSLPKKVFENIRDIYVSMGFNEIQDYFIYLFYTRKECLDILKLTYVERKLLAIGFFEHKGKTLISLNITNKFTLNEISEIDSLYKKGLLKSDSLSHEIFLTEEGKRIRQCIVNSGEFDTEKGKVNEI